MDVLRYLRFRYAPHRSWIALAVLPFMGFLLALAGPFGSYLNMPFWARCAHFALCFTVIGVLIIEGAYRLARRYFLGNWPLWMALLFDLALTPVAAGIVWVSLHVFQPAAIVHVRFIDLLWQNLLIIVSVQAVFVTVAVVQQTQLPQAEPEAGEDYPLAHRLPFALKRSSILALTSEDHYLRVYTARGEALIHMTLTEAVELLKRGFQIHRSHWISEGTVKDYRRDQVELVSGLHLPVSRHRKKEFEAWLEQAP